MLATSGRVEQGKRTQERLVGPSTTSDDTDHTTDGALDDFLGAGWELDASLALVRVVADDGHVVARSPAERTTVANLLLDIAHDGTFGDGAEGKDIADSQTGVLAGVDELASVHALVGDEGLGVQLEAIRVAKDDLGEGRAAARVVDNLAHDAAKVAMALGEVESSELCWCLVQAGVGGEDGAATLALVPVGEGLVREMREAGRRSGNGPNNTTHGDVVVVVVCVWSSIVRLY